MMNPRTRWLVLWRLRMPEGRNRSRRDTVSGVKQTEPGFPLGFCLCLAQLHVILILKNSPVLNDYKHTHDMMQPPLYLKIWKVVLSNVLYWIFPKHNTLYSGQKVNCLATFYGIIILVSCCKQDACFRICLFCTDFLIFPKSIRLVLWSKYTAGEPCSVCSCHSH